uniref:RNA polymerase subunit H/Rpb5 C-terminal domain-containing protein n=1 Tax=viral metagenome TaxID=1070528 RepID=A0A6C0HHC3_9ZZZZ
MSSNSNRILSLYKSRNNILDILESLDYKISDYFGFSINEIDAMFVNQQLDMLINHKSKQLKIYIKYFLTSKQIRPQNLDEIIEDLFVIDNVLTKADTLVIIMEEEPNETLLTKLKYLYDHDGVFVVVHNIQRLQFNILNHKLVPTTTVLSDEEVVSLKVKYNLKELTQLPEISRFDPVALAIALRPGQVCKILRSSATALEYEYYRICV